LIESKPYMNIDLIGFIVRTWCCHSSSISGCTSSCGVWGSLFYSRNKFKYYINEIIIYLNDKTKQILLWSF
jgi:hypothetical protein